MKIIPALLLALTLPHAARLLGQEAPAAPATTAAAPAPFIMEFTTDATEPSWIAVNDGVMGGLSTGGPRLENNILHFTGTLSLENNGGFSSIRTKSLTQDFSAATHLVLRVKQRQDAGHDAPEAGARGALSPQPLLQDQGREVRGIHKTNLPAHTPHTTHHLLVGFHNDDAQQ